MKYIFVFIGLFLFSFPLKSQETVGIDNPNNPVLENKTAKQEISQVEEPQKNEKETEEQASTSSAPDFDVFRPSEDISEDLAVPFPVDI